jgi:hypothetical protein
MLIIVPSYKRTDCLYWVLKSICRCNVSAIAEEKKVVVVNNHPPSRDIINSIVAKFYNDKTFTWQALHREKTLPPIDSWYSAVAQFAAEGEVVVLLGDDDLMMPWGLQDRYREIMSARADMSLSDFEERIFFFQNGQKYWLTNPLPVEDGQKKESQPWDFFPVQHPEPSFISNHCYRNTPGFRRGLTLAYSWCDAQNWLGKVTRTGMLPFYLPYAIKLSGGRVVALHSKCVLRGACAEEAVRSTFADGGNEAFYNLCAYDTLTNRSLPMHTEQVSRASVRFKNSVIRGYFTMLFDKNISWQTLMLTYKHAGLKFKDLATPGIFIGFFSVIIRLIGLRGMRLRLKSYSNSLANTEFIFR